jgi:uncharacterized membrane protein
LTIFALVSDNILALAAVFARVVIQMEARFADLAFGIVRALLTVLHAALATNIIRPKAKVTDACLTLQR